MIAHVRRASRASCAAATAAAASARLGLNGLDRLASGERARERGEPFAQREALEALRGRVGFRVIPEHLLELLLLRRRLVRAPELRVVQQRRLEGHLLIQGSLDSSRNFLFYGSILLLASENGIRGAIAQFATRAGTRWFFVTAVRARPGR